MQHLLDHDAANDVADGCVRRVLEGEVSAQVRRDGGVLEFDGGLQKRRKVIAGPCIVHILDVAGVDPDHASSPAGRDN